jgi:hypothetical protein
MTVTVVVGGYRALPKPLTAITRIAKSAKLLRFRTPARLYLYDTIFERLTQHLQGVAADLRQLIGKAHAVVGQRPLARQRCKAVSDRPCIRDEVVGARHGRVVTHAVRPSVRPATRRMRVVSIGSARIIAGSLVVSRRAAEVLPAELGLSLSRFPRAKRLTSWAKLWPGHYERGDTRKGGKTYEGSRRLPQLSVEVAHGAPIASGGISRIIQPVSGPAGDEEGTGLGRTPDPKPTGLTGVQRRLVRRLEQPSYQVSPQLALTATASIFSEQHLSHPCDLPHPRGAHVDATQPRHRRCSAARLHPRDPGVTQGRSGR